MSQNIIIIGGGIIGLSCAYELRMRGFDVTVLEARRCGGQASGAAAGMLAPFSENTEGPDAFFRLCQFSLLLYPEWQEQIRSISGVHFEYANTGSLHIAYHAADLLSLEGRRLWQRQYGSSGEIVSGAELFRMEPALSRDVLAALYTPEESHIYAPDFIRALEQACRISGVLIKEELGSIRLVEWDRHIAVSAADGTVFYGDRLVASTGAWAQELSEQLGLPIPVYPIRGQICAYRTETQPPVKHMVFLTKVIWLPRRMARWCVVPPKMLPDTIHRSRKGESNDSETGTTRCFRFWKANSRFTAGRGFGLPPRMVIRS